MEFTTDQIIEQYIALRDRKEALAAKLKADSEPIIEAMEAIEAFMLDLMNKSGENTKATSAGTAFIKTSEFVGIASGQWDEFWKFVENEPNGASFVKKDANKTAVMEYIKEHGVPPPGINYSAKREVQFRRPKA